MEKYINTLKLFISIIKYPKSFLKFKKFGKNIRLGFGGNIAHPEGITLGSNIFIALGFVISGKSLEIGSNVLIGPRLTIECDDHKFNKVGETMWNYQNKKSIKHIKISNDVWIGANVTIIGGVEIEEGSVIASQSLVNKNIPPYSVYGGIPAKFIKDRE